MTRPAFPPGVITRFEGIGARSLGHRVVPRRAGADLDLAVRRAEAARREIASDYEARYGEPLDTYRLGARHAEVLERFHAHPAIGEALTALGHPPELAARLGLPWWNESGCTERGFHPSADRVMVELEPRHSFETQLVRSGVPIGGASASVAGLLRTAPEPAHPAGAYVVGLRGGASYPNTYMLPVGALQMTPALSAGETTVFDVFVETELREELGFGEEMLEGAELRARYLDMPREREATYLFELRCRLGAEEVAAAWRRNRSEDRAEHRELRFVGAEPDEVRAFVTTFYRGAVPNELDRPDAERRLLHTGALALAAAAELPIELLQRLATGSEL